MKHNVVAEVVKGKRVILIDDSLIRGTTTTNLVRSVKEAGAKEVHLRISCPPNLHPCFYGIDFPTRAELLAANHSITEMEDMLNVDSLRYISIDGMLNTLTLDGDKFCCACFNGKYPLPVLDEMNNKFSMDRLEGADEYDDYLKINSERKGC